MNIKLHLALVGVTLLLTATACSSAKVSSSAVDPAQPATRNDKAVVLVPVTGEQSSDIAQDFQAYPNQRLHSQCVSEESQRQVNCADKGSSRWAGAILLSGSSNADSRTGPNPQVHSACASEKSQRQERCMP